MLRGHTHVVRGLSFSPDGSILASGQSASKKIPSKIILWDYKNKKQIKKFQKYNAANRVVTWSADGQTLFAMNSKGKILIWDVAQGKMVKELSTEPGYRMALSPDGDYLLVSGSNKKTWLIDLSTDKPVPGSKIMLTNHARPSFSADGKWMAMGTETTAAGNICQIFQVAGGQVIHTLPHGTDRVNITLFSPDNKLFATTGLDSGTIYLWDAAIGRKIYQLGGSDKKIGIVGFGSNEMSFAWGRGPTPISLNQQSLKYWMRYDTSSVDGDLEFMGKIDRTDTFTSARLVYDEYRIEIGKNESGRKNWIKLIKNDRLVRKIKIKKSKFSKYITSYSFTADGQFIIAGNKHGEIFLFETDTGHQIRRYFGHTGVISTLAVSNDSKLLISGATDNTVRIWNIRSGKNLLSIFHSTDNEWVAWIPEGYYTSSLTGDKYIGWHINQGDDKEALYYPANRFSSTYYSPDIVAAYLRNGGNIDKAIEYVNSKSPRGKQTKNVESILPRLPPSVEITTPRDRNVLVTGNSIQIRALAKSLTGELVDDIWVTVNGRNLGVRGIQLVGKESKTVNQPVATISVEVPLVEIKTRIAVIARNRFSQSVPEMINVIRRPAASNIDDLYKPDLYVLAIGISNYHDPTYNLDVAHKDASAITEILYKQKGNLYKEVYTKALLNQEATRDNILDGLDWLLKSATQRDTTIIFIAGHGTKDNRGNYYFMPYEADYEKLRRTGVQWFDFQDTLTSLPSKVIFLVDTCHSGSVTGKRRGITDITRELRELITTDSGVVVMTAATGKEVSQERLEWGHGAFTKAIIEGFEGKADYDGNSVIEIKELDLYITQRVKHLTNGSQHPTTEIPKTMPNFPLTIY